MKSEQQNLPSEERHRSQSKNYHKLGLAEDILINTQLYGLYNPYHYHSFMNTWNFFFPQDCDVCGKSMYPLMSDSCQCLRCGKYVHRQCLRKVKQKCTYFTFDKLLEPSPPTSVTTSTVSATAVNNLHPVTNSRSKKSPKASMAVSPSYKHPSVMKQLIKKVPIKELQTAGNLLIGTVTYLPMIAANSIVGSTPSSHPGKSSHSSSSEGSGHPLTLSNTGISKEQNTKTEIQLEKIVEKACMIPRMIGYLPEPKSQFCLWTSSLRAIALQHSQAFMNYNNSSNSSKQHDNLYLIYHEYCQKKLQLQQEMDDSGNHEVDEDVDRAVAISGEMSFINPRESFLFGSKKTDRNTFIDDVSIPAEIAFQYGDHPLYENSVDEMIDIKFMAIISQLLDNNNINLSFPAQITYVCILIFLSMDFTTILENLDTPTSTTTTSSPNNHHPTSIFASSLSKLRRHSTNTTTTLLNPYQYALTISNPHYHMIVTMRHAREAIDTIVCAILSKYDTAAMEALYFQDQESNDFLLLITRVVERIVFDRYSQAMYDKIFRECCILSSLLLEKYIAQINLQADHDDHEEIIKGSNKEGEDEVASKLNMVPSTSLASTSPSSSSPPNTSLKDNHISSSNHKIPSGIPSFTMTNPQYLQLYNDYAKKLKAYTSPLDKLKYFVLFLQFFTTSHEHIIIHYPTVITPKVNTDQLIPTDHSQDIPKKKIDNEIALLTAIATHNEESLVWSTYHGSTENLVQLVSDEGRNSPDKLDFSAPEIEVGDAPTIEEHHSIDLSPTEAIPNNLMNNHEEGLNGESKIDENGKTLKEQPMGAEVPEDIATAQSLDKDEETNTNSVPETVSSQPTAAQGINPKETDTTRTMDHKPVKIADTDELIEKLAIIMHYQQQNHIIDWIAEGIYLSSPILNKQILAYGIESYGLVTLQQAIQTLLTSFYGLTPSRTSFRSNSSSRKSLRNYYYDHTDPDEDYYFWKSFLN